MQQWLPLSLSACLSQAVHNLYPCAQCLTHWPPADLITIREFTSQGCLHLVTCWCSLPAALRFVSARRTRWEHQGGERAELGPYSIHFWRPSLVLANASRAHSAVFAAESTITHRRLYPKACPYALQSVWIIQRLGEVSSTWNVVPASCSISTHYGRKSATRQYSLFIGIRGPFQSRLSGASIHQAALPLQRSAYCLYSAPVNLLPCSTNGSNGSAVVGYSRIRRTVSGSTSRPARSARHRLRPLIPRSVWMSLDCLKRKGVSRALQRSWTSAAQDIHLVLGI